MFDMYVTFLAFIAMSNSWMVKNIGLFAGICTQLQFDNLWLSWELVNRKISFYSVLKVLIAKHGRI